MKKTRILAVIVLAGMLSILAGCAVTVGTPPPPALVEVQPIVPFYGAVWIDGHYSHEHGRYIWMPGRYVKPPRHGSRWIPGYWEKHHRGWKWHPGYWH
jgi:hypothetical protein